MSSVLKQNTITTLARSKERVDDLPPPPLFSLSNTHYKKVTKQSFVFKHCKEGGTIQSVNSVKQLH